MITQGRNLQKPQLAQFVLEITLPLKPSTWSTPSVPLGNWSTGWLCHPSGWKCHQATVIISQDGDKVVVRTQSTFKNTEISSSWRGSTVTMDGDKLVHVQKWDGKETKFVREIKDGKLVMVREKHPDHTKSDLRRHPREPQLREGISAPTASIPTGHEVLIL
ncbi:hypothetical protein F7725_019957 [Dissostichus mawsoni]|uniref:Uncharacterized protein n=1 Tax=Dissostichus mawsoni TaxID=36200 RepID=A0A7J5YPP9_DISMA|nr:hypothetical protein F7725_019957 [Dissostichus mawsoni]